jgi:plasmid stabilization system protein ParE
MVRKRSKADGHVAAYRIDAETKTVRVLRIYHTKQDWRTYLKREKP